MKKFKLLLVAAAAAAVMAAPAYAQTLRWAAQNDILTLDPHSQNHATTNAILQHTYEGLVRYNDKYEVEPALATKWTYISPTQVRFELRRNVKFHDGSPFTADDVLFSYGRIKQPQGTMGIYVTGVSEVRKIDSHTVDLMLSGPNPILLRNLVNFFVMSKTWAEKNRSVNVQDYKNNEENFASRNVMGTGSYKITGWTPEQRITMTINNDWWDKHTSNVKDVVYTPIKSDPTRIAALLSGDVDMLTDLPTQDVARLRADSKLKVLDGPEVRTIYLAPDIGSPELKHSYVKGKNPFADKRVRMAANMSIDRQSIVDNLLGGVTSPANQPANPSTFGYNPSLPQYKYDPVAAKKLLADAGYPNGFKMIAEFIPGAIPRDIEIYSFMAESLGKVGIQAEVRQIPFPDWLKKYLGGVWDGDGSGFSAFVDPHMDASRPFTNFSCLTPNAIVCIDSHMPLITAAATEMDVKKREKILQDLMAAAHNDAMTMPILYGVDIYAATPRLKNVEYWNRVLLWERMTLEGQG